MAGRPIKEGLTYFSMDVNMDQDFEALEELHGNDGFVWLVKFWQEAYKTNHGQVDLNDIRGIIAAKKARISTDKQSIIISDCIKLGLIEQVEPGIYTSSGIQKRLDKVLGKRENDRKSLENEIPDNNRSDNSAIRGESKVKEIKENKSKEDPDSAPLWKKSFEEYEKEINRQFEDLKKDSSWFEDRQRYHPNLNIRLSIEKAMNDFWGTEAGWKNKKAGRAKSIDLKATLARALSNKMNHVYIERKKN